MAGTKISARRRASYKEIARGIVGDDRAARRQSTSQNTIGAIERALVAAFLDGLTQISPLDPEANDLTWIQVPPRARQTLSNMTFWFSARHGYRTDRTDRIEVFKQNGKSRWRIVDANGRHQEHSVADGSVRPLIRLGLLEQLPDNPAIYGLSELGLELCKEYWKRSDRDDPTLPRISLR